MLLLDKNIHFTDTVTGFPRTAGQNGFNYTTAENCRFPNRAVETTDSSCEIGWERNRQSAEGYQDIWRSRQNASILFHFISILNSAVVISCNNVEVGMELVMRYCRQFCSGPISINMQPLWYSWSYSEIDWPTIQLLLHALSSHLLVAMIVYLSPLFSICHDWHC